MKAFKPLTGIKVLDFSHVVAGPLATFYLQQLGAEVVKVENRSGGDVMRRGKNLSTFVALNAGKRCVSLDLTRDDDRATALRLAAESDVLVDSLKPGTLERHGLGESASRTANRRLIYCSISGYGHEGPYRGRPAYDHIIQAATGMAMLAGQEGDGPVKTGYPVVDAATGIVAALAIIAALRERDRTGDGCFIDSSMTAAALQVMYPLAVTALNDGTSPPRTGNQGFSGSPAADLFEAKDGWIALGANTARQFLAFLEIIDGPDIALDRNLFPEPLEAGAPGGFLRAGDGVKLRLALGAKIREWNVADIEARCAARGVPCARVRRIGEFVAEAVREGTIDTIQLNDFGGTVVSPGLGFRVR